MKQHRRMRLLALWRRVWGHHAAQDEGLAAGTGLLTGTTARVAADDIARPCPECKGQATIAVIDLVAHEATWRCRDCNHEWVESGIPARRRAH